MISILENPNKEDYINLCRRPMMKNEDLQAVVSNIFRKVESAGDQAILDFTLEFDGAKLDGLLVDEDVINRAFAQMKGELKTAVQKASKNIEAFHSAQLSKEINIDFGNGIKLGQKSVPIQRVGIYIPGGTAPLLSTILMLALPARIAGCKEIVLCSPPTFDGAVRPSILAVAKMCGITEIYACGGAQAIAAMAIGTKSIKKVMKVFGPGNQYVTAAKALAVNYGCAMDLPAGPSELMVYADESSIASFVAADLLSQAEHGADSQVVLVASSNKIALETQQQIFEQIETLPRKEIAIQALSNSRFVVINNLGKCW